MVHTRINERETNPNPHINFISPLPVHDETAEEDARQLLRALAAQVKPVMKAHGLEVNSFEEYPLNKVFLGRNTNNGEKVEIVLRGAHGAFQPVQWLLSTLCHELAHIKHMNHGPGFQALWKQLQKEVRQLQSKGYYGDGYWSSGQRLADSARVGGQAFGQDEFPEYLCGGALSGSRASAARRKRRRQPTDGPSLHTGRQTAKKRKAGARVTTKGKFEGSGRALNDDVEDEDAKKAGAGFRKQAGSKSAREARALAVERRLLALQNSKLGQPSTSTDPNKPADSNSDSGDSDEDEDEPLDPETDQDRRQTLLESDAGATKLKQTTLDDFAADFIFPPSQAKGPDGSSPSGNSTKGKGKGKASGESGASTSATSKGKKSESQGKPQVGNRQLSNFFPSQLDSAGPNDTDDPHLPSRSARKTSSLSYGGIVRDEVNYRKKEALGMQAGGSRTLSTRAKAQQAAGRSGLLYLVPEQVSSISKSTPNEQVETEKDWSCMVCTLSNEPGHLVFSVCGTPRGESSWKGDS